MTEVPFLSHRGRVLLHEVRSSPGRHHEGLVLVPAAQSSPGERCRGAGQTRTTASDPPARAGSAHHAQGQGSLGTVFIGGSQFPCFNIGGVMTQEGGGCGELRAASATAREVSTVDPISRMATPRLRALTTRPHRLQSSGQTGVFLPSSAWGLTQQAVRRAWGLGGETTLPGQRGHLRNVLLGGGRRTGGPPTGSSFSLPPGIKIAERSLSLESHSAHPPLLPTPASLAVPRRGRGKAGWGSRGPHGAGRRMHQRPRRWALCRCPVRT